MTVDTDPDGYGELVAMADRHSGLRSWAIEGTGGYGAGLARYLAERGEVVIEIHRPNRPARRGGAKSDPLDAVRAGRDALAREHLAAPRAAGERAALSVLVAPRRSAVDASMVAQRQLRSLVVAAPENLRSKFRDQTTTAMITTAARLRLHASWDVETRSYAEVLRDLARRVQPLQAEADSHERAILVIVLSRLRYDPDTRAYAERRRAEGKTDREIKRCLKRYVARRLFRLLENPPATAA